MKIEIKQEAHKHLFFIDCEYDRENLKQLAGVMFRKDGNLYELIGSLNFYIKDSEPLDKFFINFTAISPIFLQQYGIELAEAKKIFNDFIKNKDDLLIVSHNLKGDEHILFKNGFDLSKYNSYCTWEHSKQYYQKQNVEFLASQQGWFLASPHDAFHDAWALVPIFCDLKEKDYEKQSN